MCVTVASRSWSRGRRRTRTSNRSRSWSRGIRRSSNNNSNSNGDGNGGSNSSSSNGSSSSGSGGSPCISKKIKGMLRLLRVVSPSWLSLFRGQHVKRKAGGDGYSVQAASGRSKPRTRRLQPKAMVLKLY